MGIVRNKIIFISLSCWFVYCTLRALFNIIANCVTAGLRRIVQLYNLYSVMLLSATFISGVYVS